MRRLFSWLDNRTGYKALVNEALYEPIPGGARWRYVWGSTLVFTFMLQMITGVLLWMAYSPSTRTAWESVYYIQNEMSYGNVVRGIHHYAAQMMVVLLAIHLIQVIIDGAYKAPREVNFWLGLVLMQIVLGLSLTGYLLPWDQKGYYATQVSTKIVGATPLVGPQLQELVQGGPEYGHHTLTRFFAMHAGVLPGLLIVFLALHIFVFRRHGITVPNKDHAPSTTFWPDQVLKDGVACLGVLAVVLLLAVFKGAELSAPADPSEPYAAARPEWYFLFLFRFLRFHAVEQFGVAFGAIYVPGILMGILALMPLIAHIKGGHKFNVAFTWLVSLGIIGLTVLAFYEDGNDPVHQSAVAEAERDSHRVRELANQPERIPVDGALTLLRNDPLTQGPRLFAKHCASCHRYDGHNGRGVVPVTMTDDGERIENPVSAADLSGFASRKWMRSIVTDYAAHLKDVENSDRFKTFTERQKQLDALKADPAANGEKLIALGIAVHRDQTARAADSAKRLVEHLNETLARKTAARERALKNLLGPDADDSLTETMKKITDSLAEELADANQELENATTAVKTAADPAKAKAKLFPVTADAAAVLAKVEEILETESEQVMNPAASDMADWSGDRDVLKGDANKDNVAALIEFLVAEANHANAKIDNAMAEKGRVLATEGGWAGDLDTCSSCHETIGEEFATRDNGGIPELSKYGSRQWLRSFLRNPGSEQHYGSKNQMPAYADKLTSREMDLLVDWLTGNYVPTKIAAPIVPKR